MHAPTPQLQQVVIDTTDARGTAEFWRQLLGLVYRQGHEPPPEGQDDVAGRDWLNLFDPDGSPRLAFQQVPDLTPTTWPEHDVPQQLHLDTTVTSVAALDAVHERILALDDRERGAVLRVARPDEC